MNTEDLDVFTELSLYCRVRNYLRDDPACDHPWERDCAQLAQAKAQLEERRIALDEVGNIAEASLKLTKVFEEAQKAADLYVENVKRRACDE